MVYTRASQPQSCEFNRRKASQPPSVIPVNRQRHERRIAAFPLVLRI
jgi:hypothetical protein